MSSDEDDNNDIIVSKNVIDVQRMKIEKLMKNPVGSYIVLIHFKILLDKFLYLLYLNFRTNQHSYQKNLQKNFQGHSILLKL